MHDGSKHPLKTFVYMGEVAAVSFVSGVAISWVLEAVELAWQRSKTHAVNIPYGTSDSERLILPILRQTEVSA
jgi:hypothetical protein